MDNYSELSEIVMMTMIMLMKMIIIIIIITTNPHNKPDIKIHYY